jgi:hypothetical protein
LANIFNNPVWHSSGAIYLNSRTNNPFNGTSWTAMMDGEMTTLSFSDNVVIITTPSYSDGSINYPYTYRGKVATIDAGWDTLTTEISGKTLILIVNGKERFVLIKQ